MRAMSGGLGGRRSCTALITVESWMAVPSPPRGTEASMPANNQMSSTLPTRPKPAPRTASTPPSLMRRSPLPRAEPRASPRMPTPTAVPMTATMVTATFARSPSTWPANQGARSAPRTRPPRKKATEKAWRARPARHPLMTATRMTRISRTSSSVTWSGLGHVEALGAPTRRTGSVPSQPRAASATIA